MSDHFSSCKLVYMSIVMDYTSIAFIVGWCDLIRGVLCLFFFGWGLKLFKDRKAIRVVNKKILKESYPELSKDDLKTRRIEINHYQYLHIKTKVSKTVIGVIAVLVVLFMAGVVSFALALNFRAMVFCCGVGLSLLGLFMQLYFNFDVKQDFWRKYLEDNPENSLKVVLEIDNEVFKTRKEMSLFFIAVGLFLVVTQIVGFIA